MQNVLTTSLAGIIRPMQETQTLQNSSSSFSSIFHRHYYFRSTPRQPHPFTVAAASRNPRTSLHRKPSRNLRYPRRAKIPPDPAVIKPPPPTGSSSRTGNNDDAFVDDSVWNPDEIEVISSLFERRTPPKKKKTTTTEPTQQKQRPPPLPTPPGRSLPTPKRHIRRLSSRSPLCDQVHKNPESLIALAREIGALPSDADASEVLDEWSPFLRKGSLSMTIRELGHMGIPERALQTLCWAQRHRPDFFPDDRILASTVEILARNGRLRMESQLDAYLSSASRTVMEAMARGFIRAGDVNRARRILLFAKDNNRTLDPCIHAKLVLEVMKNPDKHRLAEVLLEELGQRKADQLVVGLRRPQDCTAVMKACVRLGKFDAVERLFEWFKTTSGGKPTVVMYTTVIYSRYRHGRYREGLAAVWEMEEEEKCSTRMDLPAYRVVIALCVALGDLERAARYLSRLKEDGFAPAACDVYRGVIRAYAASGRVAKCRQLCRELEMMGLKAFL